MNGGAAASGCSSRHLKDSFQKASWWMTHFTAQVWLAWTESCAALMADTEKTIKNIYTSYLKPVEATLCYVVNTPAARCSDASIGQLPEA